MIYKMTKLFETSYLYKTFCKDLAYVFRTTLQILENRQGEYHAPNAAIHELFENTAKGDTPVFDIANCKLSTDVAELLANYVGLIEFTDSFDVARNQIIQQNKECYLNRTKLGDGSKLPKYDGRTVITNYIKNLDDKLVYNINNIQSDIELAVALLVIMVRPKIHFVVGNSSSNLLIFVSKYLDTPYLEKFHEFYFVTKSGIEAVSTLNGKVISQYGELSVRDIQLYGFLVPTIFGQKVLYKEEPWNQITAWALDIVQTYNDEQSIDIFEYFEREHSNE